MSSQETSQFLVEYFGEGGEHCMGAYPFYHGKSIVGVLLTKYVSYLAEFH